jgi:hypothetical protein
MSNKQSMKLYTESEIRKFFTEKYDEGLSIDELIEILTPIELPSDEELKKQFDVDEFDPYDVAYLGGAIRMRNLIQGGNK